MLLTDYNPRKHISVGGDLIISTIFGKSPDQKFEVKEIGDYKSDYYFKLQNGKNCDGSVRMVKMNPPLAVRQIICYLGDTSHDFLSEQFIILSIFR